MTSSSNDGQTLQDETMLMHVVDSENTTKKRRVSETEELSTESPARGKETSVKQVLYTRQDKLEGENAYLNAKDLDASGKPKQYCASPGETVCDRGEETLVKQLTFPAGDHSANPGAKRRVTFVDSTDIHESHNDADRRPYLDVLPESTDLATSVDLHVYYPMEGKDYCEDKSNGESHTKKSGMLSKLKSLLTLPRPFRKKVNTSNKRQLRSLSLPDVFDSSEYIDMDYLDCAYDNRDLVYSDASSSGEKSNRESPSSTKEPPSQTSLNIARVGSSIFGNGLYLTPQFNVDKKETTQNDYGERTSSSLGNGKYPTTQVEVEEEETPQYEYEEIAQGYSDHTYSEINNDPDEQTDTELEQEE